MAHRNAIIHSNGIHFLGDATCSFDLTRHHLTKIFQMHMARYELGEGVANSNNRLAEILVFHTGRTPKSAGTSHIAAMGRSLGTIVWHFLILVGYVKQLPGNRILLPPEAHTVIWS